MTEQSAKGPVKRAQISIEVIRADGTREELGVVSDSSRLWRWGFGQLLARRRIHRLNRRHGHVED